MKMAEMHARKKLICMLLCGGAPIAGRFAHRKNDGLSAWKRRFDPVQLH